MSSRNVEAGNHGTVKDDDAAPLGQRGQFLEQRGFEIVLIVQPSRIGVAWKRRQSTRVLG